MKKFRQHHLEIIDKELDRKDLRSLEERIDGKYRHGSYLHIHNPWAYTVKILRKNIGKNINISKNALYKHVKSINLHWFDVEGHIIDNIANHPKANPRSYRYRYQGRFAAPFILDSQNRIQRNKGAEKPKNYRKTYRIEAYYTNVRFFERGYSCFNRWTNEVTAKGNPSKYEKLMQEFLKDPRRDWIWSLDCKVDKTTVYKDVTKQEYVKYVYIWNQRAKLEKIQTKKEKREKAYCMMTREEVILQKEKELDKLKLFSHGFDEESFKGLHYHGQKRKLKDAS